jgi:smad nuclear-interacting protein 1
VSPEEHRHRGRHESNSSPRASRSAARIEDVNSRVNEVSGSGDADSVAKMKAAAEALEAKEKEKPSFELSGKLAEETNRVAGVNLLYSEPPEGRKSDIRWRLYVFKGGEPLNDPLYVHRMSCYLFGRERKVADVPTDHPSCSKQHAVLQYRLVEKELPDGMMSRKVRPYLMDLGSTNGTYINENRIEPRRYYELFEKDTIKFGNSSREYVLLHENSAQ